MSAGYDGYDPVPVRAPFGRLRARVALRLGAFDLDVAVAAEPGEVVAVLGPNGAGKSTLLGALAGLLHPDSGEIRLGERVLGGDGAFVSPEQRRVGLMGQDPLLFPHLTAVENIAFGPRSQGVARATARAAAQDWLRRLALGEFAHRKPAQLSGGQRQRVALARALAAKPELLLLDEPLGALDAQTAPEIRHVLRTHIRAAGITTVLVTHDVLDAATLSDRVVVLDHGRVVETGPTAEVLAAPRSEFTAALAGLNIVAGLTLAAAKPGESVAIAPVGPVPIGLAPVVGQPGPGQPGGVTVSGFAVDEIAAGSPATAVFPPSAVAVYLGPMGAGSPRNLWPATITALQPGPSAIRVRALLGAAVDTAAGENSVIPDRPGHGAGAVVSADLTAASVAELHLEPGMRVHLAVKATEVRVHAH
jgi:molybdate transport system ATP-binding protein